MRFKGKNIVIIVLSILVLVMMIRAWLGPSLMCSYSGLTHSYEQLDDWVLITLWGMAGIVFVACVKMVSRR